MCGSVGMGVDGVCSLLCVCGALVLRDSRATDKLNLAGSSAQMAILHFGNRWHIKRRTDGRPST